MAENKGYQETKPGGVVKKIDRETAWNRLGGGMREADRTSKTDRVYSPEYKAARSIDSTAERSRWDSDIADTRASGNLINRKRSDDEED